MNKWISGTPTSAKGQTIILRTLKEPDPTMLQCAHMDFSEEKLQHSRKGNLSR